MTDLLPQDIIECLPKERTRFDYFRDRYALLLLNWARERYPTIAALKRSDYAQLLDKPTIRGLVSANAGRPFQADDLINAMPADGKWQRYALGLTTWGTPGLHNQTTRARPNLVLQLNFSNEHMAAFNRLLRPIEDDIFSYIDHPTEEEGDRDFHRHTLAWSRMDIDLDRGEALIEEIQTDWIRLVERAARRRRPCKNCRCARKDHWPWRDMAADPINLHRYKNQVLTPYRATWSEAMLTATLHFLREELGIDRVWYHSAESGYRIKRIKRGRQPPQSIYSDLPRRFCFEKTSEPPSFLMEDKAFRRLQKKLRTTNWFTTRLR